MSPAPSTNKTLRMFVCSWSKNTNSWTYIPRTDNLKICYSSHSFSLLFFEFGILNMLLFTYSLRMCMCVRYILVISTLYLLFQPFPGPTTISSMPCCFVVRNTLGPISAAYMPMSAIHWSMGNLLGTTLLKKTNSPPFPTVNNCQSSTVVGSHELILHPC